MIDGDIAGPMAGMAALIIFFVFISFVGAENCDKRVKNLKENLMNNTKTLLIMWVVNLFVFTVCLWLGYYAMHTGIEWIKVPLEVTLASTGIAKAILSVMLFISLGNKKIEQGGKG